MDSFRPERDLRKLPLDRAKAVLEYFVALGGLNREKIEIYGRGDKFPIGDNKTKEGGPKNRRVLLIKE